MVCGVCAVRGVVWVVCGVCVCVCVECVWWCGVRVCIRNLSEPLWDTSFEAGDLER